MALSDKDREFMEEVAGYFRGTKSESEPEGSIQETALQFGMNRAKVRKILITTGDLTSKVTNEALSLRKEGKSVKEIAAHMGMSISTVSTYLPYEELIYKSDDVSDHAKDVREYRKYERQQVERQNKLKKARGEKAMKKDSSLDGNGETNNLKGEVAGESSEEKIPDESVDVFRLHMEVIDEYRSREDIETLHKFGEVKYGDTISRDIIVPSDIPLYALHYVIQRAFGWQNSHLHMFCIPEEREKAMTDDNAAMWSKMVGVIFRSPLMEEGEEFWADDYNGGSFKNWLRKKYTGSYMSKCRGEGLLSCHKDMMRLDMDAKYVLVWKKAYDHETGRYDGGERVADVYRAFDRAGKKVTGRYDFTPDVLGREEIVSFKELPVQALRRLFDIYPLEILERLPVGKVLVSGKKLLKDCSKDEYDEVLNKMCGGAGELYQELEKRISKIIKDNIDSPAAQALPYTFTDRLIYRYDFGDDWKIEITACDGCEDLVESQRISQAELDRALIKCRKLYRPVLIARDGAFLLDDAGGMSGFTEFLKAINPDLEEMEDVEERTAAMQEKEEYLEWAEGQGWGKGDAKDINLL